MSLVNSTITKKMIKVLVLLFLIFCFTFTFAGPVICAQRANALEEDVNEERTAGWFRSVVTKIVKPTTPPPTTVPTSTPAQLSQEVGCSVEYTCKYTCIRCNEGVFFDLRTYKHWNSEKVQAAWKNTCGSISIEKWVDQKTKEGLDAIPRKKRGWLHRSSVDVEAQAFFRNLITVFSIIEKRFKEICHGGREMTPPEVESLRGLFWSKLQLPSSNSNGIGVARNLATFMFEEFVSRHRSHNFDYCSCEKFVSNLKDYSASSFLTTTGFNTCTQKCHFGDQYANFVKTGKPSFWGRNRHKLNLLEQTKEIESLSQELDAELLKEEE
jgi:hypothetical protein